VVATIDRIKATRIGELALFDVFHPGAIDAEWNIVFRFAGNCAGVTTDARVVVNEKRVPSHTPHSPPFGNVTQAVTAPN
jgi:hypothetical protein